MPTKRISSLDGLRGIAALVVVLYHSLLVTPTLWNRIAGAPVTNPAQWILAYTPIRIIWAGGEAVWIFFILSGFVLVRPYLAGRTLSLRHYYPRRAIRLYLPFFGSFLLAMILRAVQSKAAGDQSGWIVLHQRHTTTGEALKALFLFAGDPTTLNGVWWSLRWEVWFSLLLPLVVIGARRFRHRAGRVFIGSLVVCACANVGSEHIGLFGVNHDNPLLYLPMFGIGVALAMAETKVRSLLAGRSHRTIALLAVLACVAMTSTVAVQAAVQRLDLHGPVTWAIAGPIGLTGAGALVALVLASPGLSDLFAHRRLDRLGTRSYTLYLVHEPLLVTLAIVFGLTTMTLWWIPLAVAASLAATAILFPLIERPALRLVRRIPAGTSSDSTVA